MLEPLCAMSPTRGRRPDLRPTGEEVICMLTVFEDSYNIFIDVNRV